MAEYEECAGSVLQAFVWVWVYWKRRYMLIAYDADFLVLRAMGGECRERPR